MILVIPALVNIEQLPYVDGAIPVIFADILARYLRIDAQRAMLGVGFNEFGRNIELHAATESLCPRDFCAQRILQYKSMYSWLGVSAEAYIGTSSVVHRQYIQGLVAQMKQHNMLKERSTNQIYCSTCHMTLTEQYIEGWCFNHLCFGRDVCRMGNRCDTCGYFQNVSSWQTAKCSMCGSTPEIRVSKQIYLKLNELAPELYKRIHNTDIDHPITLSDNILKDTYDVLKSGPTSRVITYESTWGVAADERRVLKEIDAPLAYLACISAMSGTANIEQQLILKDVEIVQFISKNNSFYYAIMHEIERICNPRTMAEWQHAPVAGTIAISCLNDIICTRGVGTAHKPRLYYEDLLRMGVPADALRLYFVYLDMQDTYPKQSEQTPTRQFDWAAFIKFNNEILAVFNTLVGLLDRQTIGEYAGFGYINSDILDYMCVLHTLCDEYKVCFDELRLRGALSIMLKTADIIIGLHKRIQETPPPQEVADQYIVLLANAIYCISIMLGPFAPAAATSIASIFSNIEPSKNGIEFAICIENATVNSKKKIKNIVFKRMIVVD